MVEEAVRHFGRLDILINCAAYAPVESFIEMTAKSWERALLINVRAVALSMSAAARTMMTQGSGHIINVTSTAARMALPNFAAYAATKAAVDALTRSGAAGLGHQPGLSAGTDCRDGSRGCREHPLPQGFARREDRHHQGV